MKPLLEAYLALEKWCATHRILATIPIALILIAFADPAPWGLAFGFLLVLLGEAGRIWASGHLTKNEQLATSGPYRYTRNPLYFFNLVILAGFCLMSGNPWASALALAAFAVIYRPCLRNEAAYMEALFGEDYRRWARQVPLFWPRPTGWQGEGKWALARVLWHREHKNALAMLVGALVFVAIWWWRHF